MDKKTKLYLGIGVVAVGAYLLLKSKKAKTPSLTSAVEPAKFVGANGGMINSLNSPTQKFNAGGPEGDRMKNADGTPFASVGYNYRPISGGMINSTEVVGARAGSQNSGIFANQPFTGDVANMVGANGEPVFANLFGRRKRRKGKTGSVEVIDLGGEYITADGTGSFFDPRTARYGQNEGVFANKPFVGDVANMVGANGEPVFANLFGRKKKKGSVQIGELEGSFMPSGKTVSVYSEDLGGEFLNQSGKFFKPRTARYGQNEGVFVPKNPKRTLPVEPNMPMPVTQPAPLNNLVGANGGFFSVHDGFLK